MAASERVSLQTCKMKILLLSYSYFFIVTHCVFGRKTLQNYDKKLSERNVLPADLYLLERSNRVGMFSLESDDWEIFPSHHLYPILGLKMALSSVAAFCIRWCFAPLPLHL